jgi:hypothetical protein
MDHLRALLKYFKDKHPDKEFPRASDELYTHLTDVLTPHAMKIMQRDNSVFLTLDAPEIFPGIKSALIWDKTEEAWKLLHMTMVFSFFRGDPKEKVSQLVAAMKHMLPATHGDTDEILKTLETEETASSLSEIFELLMTTRLASIVGEIATSIKLEDIGIDFERPEEILEALQHPERSQAVRYISEQVKTMLEERIKTGKINQTELIREIEMLKAKFQSSFGKYMKDMIGIAREGPATGNTAEQILGNSPEARRARMMARLQRKQREKGRR